MAAPRWRLLSERQVGKGEGVIAMIVTLQSSVRADIAAALGSTRRYARSTGLVAVLTIVTGGIVLLSTNISVAQQSPEVVETIGDAYQIGRLKTNGGMVVQTILYNGRPIATGVMLPGRAEEASASRPGAAGALKIAGTVLTGQVSGKYFILHRTRGNRSTIHEIFFDGESVGQVAEEAAPAPTSEPRRGNDSQDGTTPQTVTRGSAFSFEPNGDGLLVRVVEPDGTIIRATSHNGGRLEQVIERSAVAVPGAASNSAVSGGKADRVDFGNAVPLSSGNAAPPSSGHAPPPSSGNDDIANEAVPRHAVASRLGNLPPAPPPSEAKPSTVLDNDPTVASSAGEQLKSTLPKIRIPLPRQPPSAIPERPRRTATAPNPFATAVPTPRAVVPALRPQISRTPPQRTNP